MMREPNSKRAGLAIFRGERVSLADLGVVDEVGELFQEMEMMFK